MSVALWGLKAPKSTRAVICGLKPQITEMGPKGPISPTFSFVKEKVGKKKTVSASAPLRLHRLRKRASRPLFHIRVRIGPLGPYRLPSLRKRAPPALFLNWTSSNTRMTRKPAWGAFRAHQLGCCGMIVLLLSWAPLHGLMTTRLIN